LNNKLIFCQRFDKYVANLQFCDIMYNGLGLDKLFRVTYKLLISAVAVGGKYYDKQQVCHRVGKRNGVAHKS
jgi:hypothetical protein